MEIERKFMLDKFPELPLLERADVAQGYLCTRPTVRIRSKRSQNGANYKLCFKGAGTLVREEIELELTEEVYNRLLKLLPGEPIRKDYRVYALPGGFRLECSRVDAGTPHEFLYAEVEFETVEQANAFVPPPFLGRDITEAPGSSMSAYWDRTRGGRA